MFGYLCGLCFSWVFICVPWVTYVLSLIPLMLVLPFSVSFTFNTLLATADLSDVLTFTSSALSFSIILNRKNVKRNVVWISLRKVSRLP